ncbi:MAG: Hsp20/alpha crystallin family protein [Oligoflexus sp.]
MTRLDLFREPRLSSRYMNPWSQFFKDFDNMFRDFDRRLDQGQDNVQSVVDWRPSYDLKETDKEYVLSMDLPGMKRDQINIELQGDRLLISGERKDERKEEENAQYLVQKTYGRFQNVFSLPEGLNRDQIEADYEDGVLYLVIPKSEETEAKKIRIGENKGGLLRRMIGKKEENSQEKIA